MCSSLSRGSSSRSVVTCTSVIKESSSSRQKKGSSPGVGFACSTSSHACGTLRLSNRNLRRLLISASLGLRVPGLLRFKNKKFKEKNPQCQFLTTPNK